MPIWLIEPRDPLITRDGRPFGPNPGARANSLPFPYPSTLAGAIRTTAGRDANGVFDCAQIPSLLNQAVRGPLLVEYSEGAPLCFLAPAPADALLLEAAGDAKSDVSKRQTRAERKWLAPLALDPAAQCGWPKDRMLQPVGPHQPSPAKPLQGAPRFWRWDKFEQWLLNPHDDTVLLSDLGHGGAVEEKRMHVRIAAATQTAEEGMLFQTAGREFTHVPVGVNRHARLEQATRLALSCATDAALREGVTAMGGERRLVHWRKLEAGKLPDCPDGVRRKIGEQGACRLLLLTPAYFTGGFLPQWLLSAIPGLAVRVIGAALGRFQGISGWDLDKRAPKEARKLAPAGAVYYLKLEGTPAARAQFADKIWMQCVSDDRQSRLDGFGLAVLGVWDGKLQQMEVSDAH